MYFKTEAYYNAGKQRFKDNDKLAIYYALNNVAFEIHDLLLVCSHLITELEEKYKNEKSNSMDDININVLRSEVSAMNVVFRSTFYDTAFKVYNEEEQKYKNNKGM